MNKNVWVTLHSTLPARNWLGARVGEREVGCKRSGDQRLW